MFPEYRDLITRLKAENKTFARLFDEHNDLAVIATSGACVPLPAGSAAAQARASVAAHVVGNVQRRQHQRVRRHLPQDPA